MSTARMIVNESANTIKFVDFSTDEVLNLSPTARLAYLQSGYKAHESELQKMEKSGQQDRAKKLRNLFVTEIEKAQAKSNQPGYTVPVLFRPYKFSNQEITEILRGHCRGH